MSSVSTPTETLSRQPSSCLLLHALPTELHVNVLSYLRAYDLNSVVQTCRFLHAPELLHQCIEHTAKHVYSSELTEGFDQQQPRREEDDLYGIQHLRNMELLVVARVLSRPEPTSGGFYVSKSWCKQALKWLEVQQEALNSSHSTQKKKKLTKKQQRIRDRRLSDVSPPWPNVNADLVCEHQNLQRIGTKASRARRKLLDKHAWKVLKKLYPDSASLDSCQGECVQCILEEETRKRNVAAKEQQEKEERKRPLSCPLVRGIYTRTRGVPMQSLVASSSSSVSPCCPLQPGQYHVLPRSWCHSWRRYLKTGEGEVPCAPCASLLLCDAHRLPLIPPHLEAYLRGDNLNLYTSSASYSLQEDASPSSHAAAAAMPVVGLDHADDNTLQALRAAGLSPSEVASQRLAMLRLERERHELQHRELQQQHAHSSPSHHVHSNDALDRENCIVVELLSHEEYLALEKWWPKVHSNFSCALEIDNLGKVTFQTPPCRSCDPRGSHCRRSDLYVKRRARGWIQKSSNKPRAPASLEY